MRKRLFLITSSIIVILLCAVTLLLVWLFPLLSSPDSANTSAAIMALNHTPINRVEQVNVFTGGQLERSVQGIDSLGRKIYVFVSGNQVFSVLKNSTISANKAQALVSHSGFPIQSIVSVVPGMLSLANMNHTSSQISPQVWEVTAKLTNGQYLFVYLDLHTGRRIYDFSTAPMVAVSSQVSGYF